MSDNKVFKMKFFETYPLYLGKAQRKGRTQKELNEIICWLTGYSEIELEETIKNTEIDMEAFFTNAPAKNPNRNLIKGSICGVKIAELEDGTMKEIRYLDKLVDELAKGKTMDKILK